MSVYAQALAALSIDGVPIPLGSDDGAAFADSAPDWTLSGPTGQNTQALVHTTDRSGTITIQCGPMSQSHVVLSTLYDIQRTVDAAIGIGPIPIPGSAASLIAANANLRTVSFRLPNGDTKTGRGKLVKPQAGSASAQPANVGWSLVMPHVETAHAVGLGAALAAAGAV